MHGIETIIKQNREAARRGLKGKKAQAGQRKRDAAERIAGQHATVARIMGASGHGQEKVNRVVQKLAG